MVVPLLLGIACHVLTGSFTCDPNSVSHEIFKQKSGISRILAKELGTLENITETEVESHVRHTFDEFLASNTVSQSDQAGDDENVHDQFSYRPTNFEVLHCSWCVQADDVFLWTANPLQPGIPYGTSCESLNDLKEEAASGNSTLYAVGYSTRLLGCYNRLFLGLYHLNQKDVPKNLTEFYRMGYNLLEEVNWSLTWPMQTDVEVVPLEGLPNGLSQETSV